MNRKPKNAERAVDRDEAAWDQSNALKRELSSTAKALTLVDKKAREQLLAPSL
jgi:hypothetical protein